MPLRIYTFYQRQNKSTVELWKEIILAIGFAVCYNHSRMEYWLIKR